MTFKNFTAKVNEPTDPLWGRGNGGSASYRQNFKIFFNANFISLAERDILMRDQIIEKAMSVPIEFRASYFLQLVDFYKRLEILNSIRNLFKKQQQECSNRASHSCKSKKVSINYKKIRGM